MVSGVVPSVERTAAREEGGLFRDVGELRERAGLSPAHIERLASADAFTSISRAAVIHECEEAHPLLGAVARAWLSSSSRHVIVADGDASMVDQHVGLDQGCPLSPGFYAVATRRARQRTQDAMRQSDPLARVPAFLDDTYMAGYPDTIELGRHTFDVEMAKLNLSVNKLKEKFWRANAAAPLGASTAGPAGAEHDEKCEPTRERIERALPT